MIYFMIVITASVNVVAMDMSTFNSKLADFKSTRYSENSKYVDSPGTTGGYSCFGFANEIAKYMFSSYPTNSKSARTVNSGWSVTHGGDAVDNLAVGDIVRYNNHSIFITGINSDTIYYCDANSNNDMIVHYNKTYSRSTLKSKVSKNLKGENTITGWVAHYKDGIVSGGNASTPCSHKYSVSNGNEICTKCGQQFQRTYTNVNATYKVIVKNSTIKTMPYSACNDVLATLKAGTKVTVKRSFKNRYNNLWYEVQYGNITGYMYSEKLVRHEEKAASTLNIDLTSYPSSLKQGSGYGLRGTIKSNYNISRIEGYVQNASGSNVLTSVDTPNKKSVDVKGANLNNKLEFNKLPAGNYSLIVKAYDASGSGKTVTKSFSVYAEQKQTPSSLSINLAKYPVSLNQGSSYGLRGSIDSNYKISEVRGYVLDSSGNTVLSSKDYPNSTSMNIQYADLNNSLVFNKLGAGNYQMKVVAYDVSGRQVTATKNFTVKGANSASSNAASTLSINMTSYPSNINQGSGFGLRGSVDSNYNITSVKGYVINSSGNTVLSSSDYPNSTSLNVRYANLNNDLVFNNLSAGAYTMKIIASDSKTTKEWSCNFTVNGGSGSAVNTRSGIVNIPSSWDDLSIRSGPSTNYQIVGSMKNGVRCTVYPDKASNGWYYVEYNGIKGYAAGNRINLQ